MIIDSHVHLCEPPYNQDELSAKMADGRVVSFSHTRAETSVDRLLRDMDECQVDQALVMATTCLSNEYLSELVRAHPTRLVGFAWVTNPRDGDESVRQLDKAVNELGLRGLKLLPDLQGFSPADPEIVPLIRRAAELDIPILIHSHPGLWSWAPGGFHYSLPEHFDTLKKRVPEATLIVGHMGGVRFLDLLTIARQQGVYVETSGTLRMIADLFGTDFATRFIRRLGVDNVLYGSDWFFGPPMSNKLSLIRKMDLTAEEKGKILGGNIRRVLEARS